MRPSLRLGLPCETICFLLFNRGDFARDACFFELNRKPVTGNRKRTVLFSKFYFLLPEFCIWNPMNSTNPTNVKTVLALVVLLLTVTLSTALPAHAGRQLVIDSDRQFEYAEHLFDQKEFAGAIVEFKRFIYFFPEDNRIDDARYRLGMAFFFEKQYPKAIAAFQRIPDDSRLAVQSGWMISRCHLAQNNRGAALLTLHNMTASVKDIDALDETWYRMGWIYLDAADWDQAKKSFDHISSEAAGRYRIDDLDRSLSRHHEIPRKNPALAGALSIVPGAGQLYCERPHDALVAFLLNTGLIWAAWESFDHGQEAAGTLFSVAGLGFYSGNIYSAVNSAHKYNRSQTRTFIENLRQNTRIGLSPGPDKGLLFSLRYRF